MLRHSLMSSEHLDTPLVRSGSLQGRDTVRWRIHNNVHRQGIASPAATSPKELGECPQPPTSPWGVSLTEKDGVGFGNFSFQFPTGCP